MLRVVLAGNTAWGMYNFRKELITKFVSLGYSVTVLAPEDDYSKRLRGLGCETRDVVIDRKGVNILKDLSLYRAYKKIFSEIEPDVLLTYTIKPNIYAALAARKQGVKVFSVITGLGKGFEKKGLLNFVVKVLFKFSQKKARKVLFLNKEDAKTFMYSMLIKNEQLDYLPGEGVDIDWYKPRARNPNSKFIYLMICRLIWEKGVREFVEASKKVADKGHDIECQLIGFVDVKNESSVQEVDIKLWEAQGAITFLGKIEDVRGYISNADCVVLPSYYSEGLPRVLLEASSMETPIITTDHIGCRDVVVDGYNGLLCEPKDYLSLSEKMEQILETDDNELAVMGKNGRLLVMEKYSNDLVLDKYLDLIGY